MALNKSFQSNAFTGDELLKLLKDHPGKRVQLRCGAAYFTATRKVIQLKVEYQPSLCYSASVDEDAIWIETTKKIDL